MLNYAYFQLTKTFAWLIQFFLLIMNKIKTKKDDNSSF